MKRAKKGRNVKNAVMTNYNNNFAERTVVHIRFSFYFIFIRSTTIRHQHTITALDHKWVQWWRTQHHVHVCLINFMNMELLCEIRYVCKWKEWQFASFITFNSKLSESERFAICCSLHIRTEHTHTYLPFNQSLFRTRVVYARVWRIKRETDREKRMIGFFVLSKCDWQPRPNEPRMSGIYEEKKNKSKEATSERKNSTTNRFSSLQWPKQVEAVHKMEKSIARWTNSSHATSPKFTNHKSASQRRRLLLLLLRVEFYNRFAVTFSQRKEISYSKQIHIKSLTLITEAKSNVDNNLPIEWVYNTRFGLARFGPQHSIPIHFCLFIYDHF